MVGCLNYLGIAIADPLVVRQLHVNHSWRQLFAAAVVGNLTYRRRGDEEWEDWVLAGGIIFDSTAAVMSERLDSSVKIPIEGLTHVQALELYGSCLARPIQTGIWVVEFNVIGPEEQYWTVLEARHLELFMREDYMNGTLNYEVLAERQVNGAPAVAMSIFDVDHLEDSETQGVYNLRSWTAAPDAEIPFIRWFSAHAVAYHSHIRPPNGYHIRYEVMRASETRSILSIRISHRDL